MGAFTLPKTLSLGDGCSIPVLPIYIWSKTAQEIHILTVKVRETTILRKVILGEAGTVMTKGKKKKLVPCSKRKMVTRKNRGPSGRVKIAAVVSDSSAT